ncbi:histidinol phosphate phosphatase domain-containing protein [Candidatus Omnitrophota bacterium]
MYDLHTHSLLSDGVLLPSEMATRYLKLGYKAIAVTDHVDYSNIKSVVSAITEFCRNWPKDAKIKILPGVELTHLPLNQFKPLARYARAKGIKVIVAHGETVNEPVTKGTNRACLEAGIDILAHPGLISDNDALLAKKKKVFLEVTARRGHKVTNAHVVERGLKSGAKLILNTDSHTPEDIITPDMIISNARRAGLSLKEIDNIYFETKKFLKGRKVRC